MPGDVRLRTYDYESVTVSTSAVSLTRSKYRVTPPAKAAIVTVDTAPIRWRDDGTAPTSSEGHFATPTVSIFLDNPSRLENFQAIRDGSTDGKIRVSFLR